MSALFKESYKSRICIKSYREVEVSHFKESDLEELEHGIDKELCNSIGLAEVPSRKDLITYIKNNIMSAKSSRCGSDRLAIREVESGKLIGCLSYYKILNKPRTYELGYWLFKEYRHKGIMKAVILSEIPKVYKVFDDSVLIIRAANEASVRIAELAGFNYYNGQITLYNKTVYNNYSDYKLYRR